MHVCMYVCMRAFCAAAATNAAKERGDATGIVFVVDLLIKLDDGSHATIQAHRVPFSKKTLNGRNKGCIQYRPQWHRRKELGVAEEFTITVPKYEELCTKGTLQLDRPKSRYTITLTLVD